MKPTSIFALALALVAAPAASLPAGTGPSPNTVHIQSIGYGGTGCPQGSVSTSISGDQTTMTMIFDKYVASLGPGIPVTENRKNCQLNVDIRYPAGFQYSLFSADYRGYVGLDAGVTGVQKSTYYFSGQNQQVTFPYPPVPSILPSIRHYPTRTWGLQGPLAHLSPLSRKHSSPAPATNISADQYTVDLRGSGQQGLPRARPSRRHLLVAVRHRRHAQYQLTSAADDNQTESVGLADYGLRRP